MLSRDLAVLENRKHNTPNLISTASMTATNVFSALGKLTGESSSTMGTIEVKETADLTTLCQPSANSKSRKKGESVASGPSPKPMS